MAYYDLVIIGGGIHGVGVAQAAAAAGFSVLLLEKNELASGSSSDKNDFSKPRDTVLYKSHNRVINVYGSKLTTYRSTAKRVMKKLSFVLPPRNIKALTENIKLKG